MNVHLIGKNWDTNDGLRNHLILIIGSGLALFSKWPDQLVIWGILTSGTLAIFYTAWRYRRSVTILRKRINIVFALYNASQTNEVEKYIRGFEATFLENVKRFDLRFVKVDFKPSDFQINSRQEAERIAQLGYQGHTLVIWGSIQEFRDGIKCHNTNFSYEFSYRKYYPNASDEQIKKIFKTNIEKHLGLFSWTLDLSYSKDFETYTNNVQDVATYILALCLMSSNELAKAIDLLRKSLKGLEGQSGRIKIVSAYKQLLSQIYVHLSIKEAHKRNWPKYESYALEALYYDKNNYNANLSMCYIAERIKKDEAQSKSYLLIAERNRRGWPPTLTVNKAYFEFKNGKYKEALRLYGIIRKHNFLDTNPVTLVEDLLQIYEETNKPAFLFAAGFIEHIFLPGKNLEKLNQFLQLTENDKTTYLILRDEAERTINS